MISNGCFHEARPWWDALLPVGKITDIPTSPVLVVIREFLRLPLRPLARTVVGVKTRLTRFVLALLAVLLLPGGILHAATGKSVTISWAPNTEPDIAGYTICIGTSSGSYPQILTTASTSTVVSGLAPFTTYYCVVRAFNTHGLTGEFSEEISFSTSSSAEWFESWVTSQGLSGNNALPSSNPARDGVSNLLKFAFNLDPTRADLRVLKSATGTAGLPLFSLERSGSLHTFRVEFLRRKAIDLQYTPMITTDLRNFAPMTGTTTVTSIDNTWERVVIRQAVDPSSLRKLFGRVAVTLP